MNYYILILIIILFLKQTNKQTNKFVQGIDDKAIRSITSSTTKATPAKSSSSSTTSTRGLDLREDKDGFVVESNYKYNNATYY